MIVNLIFENCGLFAVPQILLSVVTVGLLVGYGVATIRGELMLCANPWEKTLVPLAEVSVSLGLLGSVVGFIEAFGGFQNGLDVHRLTEGLSVAYWTTGLGITNSLVVSLGSYMLAVVNRQED